MEPHFYKSTGFSLISGALLIITTMVLHPFGGSMEHILNISGMITFTHAMAIFSLPLLLFGFYGITHRLLNAGKISVLAFIIMAFGSIAAMFAALINGLALPYFLEQNAAYIPENAVALRPVVHYGFALNTSLDYIFIIACCLSIGIYALLILWSRTYTFPKWLGYFGIALIILVFMGALLNFVFTSLSGFRIVIFSFAGWILAAGATLIKTKAP